MPPSGFMSCVYWTNLSGGVGASGNNVILALGDRGVGGGYIEWGVYKDVNGDWRQRMYINTGSSGFIYPASNIGSFTAGEDVMLGFTWEEGVGITFYVNGVADGFSAQTVNWVIQLQLYADRLY